MCEDSDNRCCTGPLVEGCGCPEGSYDDGKVRACVRVSVSVCTERTLKFLSSLGKCRLRICLVAKMSVEKMSC